MIRREFCKTLALASSVLESPVSMAKRSVDSTNSNFPKAPGLTKYVAEFVVNTKYEDIPEEVIELGKKTMLDAFGLALAGSASIPGANIRKYIQRLGCSNGKASIIGTGLKTTHRFAALANGISIHADDYDDTGAGVHVAAPVLPAAFAFCETDRRTGKELTLAFHVGVEIENKIAQAISPRHHEEGFHTTGTCGSFGGAAAAAKLHGFDARQTAITLGIAGSEASGLRDNFGTMTKSFHAGHAAENGVVAADLVLVGWTAAEDILEAPLGFYQAAGGTFNPSLIEKTLGNPWMFVSPGDLIKRFPCGTIQQAFMDETLRMIRDNNITAAEVEKVDIAGNRSNVSTLFYHHPTTGLEAKFSMEFAVSILLLDGKAGLGHFTDAVVKREDVQNMLRRTNFHVDPEFNKTEGRGEDLQTVLVENGAIAIHMKDGSNISGHTKPAKGSPKNPLTYEEVAEKFRANAEFAKWPAQKAEFIIDQVKSMEKVSDVSKLTAAFTS
jgi:2-methylcitrate dehydratase PrpD